MKIRQSTAAFTVAVLCAIPSALEAQWFSRLGHHGYVTYPALAERGITFSAHYARGLWEDSFGTNHLAARVELASQVFGVWGGIGWLKPDNDRVWPDGEYQVGANGGAGLHLLRGAFQLSLQVGVGYLNREDQTSIRIPGGPCFAFSFNADGATVRPWIMPYMQIQDVGDGSSSVQEGAVGTSAGMEWRLRSKLGLSVAFDLSWTDLGDMGYAGGDQLILLADFGLSYHLRFP